MTAGIVSVAPGSVALVSTGDAAAPGDANAPEVIFFADASAFRDWLERHHEHATEVWVERRPKGHPDQGLTWEASVVEALCFGWIDSTSRRIGDVRAQRFSPRKPSSNWSAVNIAHVERLTAEGLMRPAGLAAYARRPPERSGVYSYDARDELDDLESAAIAADPAAHAFWSVATPGYHRICANWVHSTKREQTRTDRLAVLVASCAAGELIPSQRYGTAPAWGARAAAAAAAAAGR